MNTSCVGFNERFFSDALGCCSAGSSIFDYAEVVWGFATVRAAVVVGVRGTGLLLAMCYMGDLRESYDSDIHGTYMPRNLENRSSEVWDAVKFSIAAFCAFAFYGFLGGLAYDLLTAIF